MCPPYTYGTAESCECHTGRRAHRRRQLQDGRCDQGLGRVGVTVGVAPGGPESRASLRSVPSGRPCGSPLTPSRQALWAGRQADGAACDPFMTATFNRGRFRRFRVTVQQRLVALSRRGVGFGVVTIERSPDLSVLSVFLAVFDHFRPLCARNANGPGRGRQWATTPSELGPAAGGGRSRGPLLGRVSPVRAALTDAAP